MFLPVNGGNTAVFPALLSAITGGLGYIFGERRSSNEALNSGIITAIAECSALSAGMKYHPLTHRGEIKLTVHLIDRLSSIYRVQYGR